MFRRQKNAFNQKTSLIKIRHSLITSERDLQTIGEKYQEMDRTRRQHRLKAIELYSTLESRIIANSVRELGQATCLRNTCILNHNSSIPERKLYCQLLNSDRAEPDVSYAEVKLKTPSAPRVRKDRDGQNTTYSELNVRKKKPRIDKDEHSPISSGPGGRSTAAETAEPDVSYVEVNFKTPSAPRVRADRDGLKSTYSELNVRKKKHRVDEDEDPPISSGPGGLSTAAQTGQSP
ncbi:uncharacterized protein LOC132389299 [Hypanus sabinus]|uniref:uncharacterized protein LOC132389299 n=1 Tax=Hypanus sabinus TaxID=79690 RepID=UPI0028C3BCCF|nr:uncharacterized protein LOC132389299 [Hypanus sabinus]